MAQRILFVAVAALAAGCSIEATVTTGGGGTDGAATTTGGGTTEGGTDGDVVDSDDATAPDEDVQDGPECPPQTGQRPGAISEHRGVFDPVKERLIFATGNPEFPVECIGKNSYLADTWAYWPRCGVWEKLPEGPGPRGRTATVYADDLHAMVMVGGRFREKGADPFTTPYTLNNETWLLELTTDTWTQLATGGEAPSPRVNSAAVYDSVGKRMILFGGNASNNGASYIPLQDTYALDLTSDTWTRLTTTGDVPSSRLFMAHALDTKRRALVVMFGGDAQAFTGPFLSDVYSLDLETLVWTRLHDGNSGVTPARRIWGRAIYSHQLDRMVLFGGHDDGALGNRNDIWMFDPGNKVWELVALNDGLNNGNVAFCDFPKDFATITPDTPERRGSHLMLHWADQNTILVHGGKTDCGLIDDVWQLNLQTYAWTNLEGASVGESCLRFADEDQCQGHCL